MLSQDVSTPINNRLLASLPHEEYERLRPYLEPVSLELKQELYQPHIPIEFVYFPLSGVCSLLSRSAEGELIEVGIVGNEGMVGLEVFLRVEQVPGVAMMQVAGDGLRMRKEDLRSQVTPETALFKALLRYTQTLINLISQSVLCNRLHSLEQRCCRWLLLMHDRVGADQFSLSREFLSHMLGMGPVGVIQVMTELQEAGLISYHSDKMTILNRAGVEATSCECYRLVQAEFERLIGDSP